MRPVAMAILICLVCLRAVAQQQPGPQISAAAADAMESLQRHVLNANVSPTMTLRDLLDRVGGREELIKSLHAAQQIGGPRWLDDQTVQVRLLLDGGQVARTVMDIVHKNAKNSPIAPDTLEHQLAGWRNRTFSATGVSTGSGDLARLQPPPEDRVWASVPEASRRDALSAARDHAVEHVIDSLRPIQIAPDQTLDQAFAVPEVNQTVRSWIWARPVKAVQFEDDLSVQLILSAPADELWHVLHSALSRQKDVTVPTSQAGWDWLEGQVTARAAPAMGVGVAQPGNQPAVAAGVAVPLQPPAWANQLAQAEATSPARPPNQLKTARAAEAMAMEKLRRQIEALPLDSKTTLGQAARHDPRIEQAILHAMKHARPYQVDYGDKGAVTVYVGLNLADLWSQLAVQE